VKNGTTGRQDFRLRLRLGSVLDLEIVIFVFQLYLSSSYCVAQITGNQRTICTTGADWASWNLPGGPVGPVSRWTTTPHVEVGQTTYSLTGEGYGATVEKGARDNITKMWTEKEGVEWERRPEAHS